MGDAGARCIVGLSRYVRAAMVFAVGVTLVFTILGGGSARAAACDTSWKNAVSGNWGDPANWDNGVPTSTSNACITMNGTYQVRIIGQVLQVHSLTLGGSAGTQTLSIQGATSNQASLAMTAGGSISGHGGVDLTDNCSSGSCTPSPAATLINSSRSSQLINGGTIATDPGADGGVNLRQLQGNITNAGTISLGTRLTYAAGTLDNRGTISLGNKALTLLFAPVTPTPAPAVKNATGGVITNGGGTGAVLVNANGRFIQAGGATQPATAKPAHPAVVFADTTYVNPLPSLSYAGGGASTVAVRGGARLSGNVAAHQNVIVDGVNSGGCKEAQVTAATSFTNAGRIRLTGACDASLQLTGGTLTNTGTLAVDRSPNPSITREIKGGLSNTGTVSINGPTAFDRPGATLRQTRGRTAIGSGQTLDLTSSGSTFRLQGGLLSGGGHTRAQSAFVNGSVHNTGGDVLPGSTRGPGRMTFDGGYTQGPRGKLTVVIDGTSVGAGYGQLAVGQGSTLGGTLAIKTLLGPRINHLYTILGGSNVSGRFATVLGRFPHKRAFPPGWTAGYKPEYFPTAVALGASPAAGLNVKRSGSGSVTSSPSAINCGRKCLAPFFKNQTVTLTEHPAGGSTFRGWSGACTGRARTCRVKMNRAQVVTARFS